MGLECERKMDQMDRKDQMDLALVSAGPYWLKPVFRSDGPFERFK